MSSNPRLSSKPVLFVVASYGLSLLLVGTYLAVGGTGELPGRFLLSVAYMFVPLISATLVQELVYHQPFMRTLRLGFKPNRWWLLSWCLPLVLVAATLAVSLLSPSISFSQAMEGLFQRFGASLSADQLAEIRSGLAELPLHPVWLVLIEGMIAGATVNAIAAFGEEAGWRGLLLSELLPLGFWRCSFTIGLVWGLWHVPLILTGHNYPEHPVVGVGLMTVFCVLVSPLLTLLVIKARSVIAAAVFHGTLNALALLPVALVDGGNDLTVGLTGIPGLMTLAECNAIIHYMIRNIDLLPDN